MKKHVSPFLALLMLFSALFALPAEAAQLEQIQNEQSYDSTDVDSIRSQVSAPRTTDLDVPSNRTVLAGGIGNEITAACSHTYKNLQYNASQHKKVCTKCGYTTYAAHTIKYASQSATQHKKQCTVCGYSAVVSHTIKYQNCGNTHQKYCSLCGYSTGEGHTYGTYTNLTENYHKMTCTKCGGTNTEKHTFSYTSCGSVHNKHCTKCGYSVNESHTAGTITNVGSSSAHQVTCAKCKGTYSQAHTNWKYSDASAANMIYGHYKSCKDCGYSFGLVSHSMYCLRPLVKDITGSVIESGIMKCRHCSYGYEYWN